MNVHWTQAFRSPAELGGEAFFRLAVREWERHLREAVASGVRGIVTPDGFERDLTRAQRTRLANESIAACESRIRFWLTQLHDHRRQAVESPTTERRAA